jgi:hypothetical protein
MASKPQESLPRQAGTWGDLLGAYRLFNNPAVDPSAIQEPHRQITRERCRGQGLVLCVQDTSEMDYTAHRAKKDLGPIGRLNGQGFLQHSALAVLPNGRLLGVLHQRWQARVEAPKGETRAARRARWNEGQFWPEAVEAVGPAPQGARFVTVTDRGGDSFETLAACDRMGHGFVVRAQHDRCVHEPPPAVRGGSGGGSRYLWAHMQGLPVLRTIKVNVPARAASKNAKGLWGKARPARRATVQVRGGAVTLEAPKGDPRHSQPRQVYVVYAREVDAPPGVKEPIDWMLLTSEPVRTARQALRIIGLYRRRWVIEEYHKVQKSGCHLEHSRLQDLDALRRLAALVGVLSVRMLWLRDLAAEAAQAAPATAVVKGLVDKDAPAQSRGPESLRALMPKLWITVVARMGGIDEPRQLTPQQFWRIIARRGGWLGRKHDGRPGWQTVWRGWNEVALLVEGAQLLERSADQECV